MLKAYPNFLKTYRRKINGLLRIYHSEFAIRKLPKVGSCRMYRRVQPFLMWELGVSPIDLKSPS